MKRFKFALAVAAVCACALVSVAKTTNLTESVVLAGDTDWRGRGVVLLDQGGAIDLAGHSLWTDGISSPGDEDVTEPDADGTHVTTSTLGSGTGAVLFDNDFSYRMTYTASGEYNFDTNKNHRVLGSGVSTGNPLWVAYDFKAATCVRGYKIHFQSSTSSDRAPKAWTFEGSNDNAAWTVLDERTGEAGWKNPESRLFAFSNETPFRSYRLKITSAVSGQYVEFYQLELFGVSSAAVDLTTTDATRAFSPRALQDGTAATLFDNRFTYSSHRILVNGSNYFPARFGYDFGKPTSVSAYRIYYHSTYDSDPSYGGAIRAPRAWTFEGTDDTNANNWTVLDRRNNAGNAMGWANPDVRTFDVANPGSFRYYRLNVEGPVSNVILELYQLEFLGHPAVRSNPTSLGTEAHDLTADASKASTTSTLYAGTPAVLFDNDFRYRANVSSGTLFDTNANHRILLQSGNLPLIVDYDFSIPTVVNGYGIYYDSYGGQPAPDRAPKSWTFEGSDDPAGPWAVLDTRTGITGWTRGGANFYFFANGSAYRCYRLNVTAINGSNLEIYQLEYFNRPAGELHLDIAAGLVVSNRTVALEGSVKLVKEGEGTFVAGRENQSYFGGTDVDAGTLRAGADGATAPLGATDGSSTSPGSTVTVSTGGVFDIGGLGGWSNYPIVLNGGKLVCNSGAGIKDTFRNISQTAASSIEIPSAFVMGDSAGGGSLDLGGCELAVNLVNGGSWTIGLPVISNGKLVTLVNGQEAPQNAKLASWDAMPTFTNVKLYHAQAEEDGLYANCPGGVIIFR